MIWLLTDAVWQPVAERVQQRLHDVGQKTLAVTSDVCRDLTVCINGTDLSVSHCDQALPLPDAVLYLRDPIPYPAADAELCADETQFVVQQWQTMLRGLITALEADGVPVLNPIAAELVDEKTAQLISAARAGFTTPPALHTANSSRAYAFAQRHGDGCATKPFAPFVRATAAGSQRLLTNVVGANDLRHGLANATTASPTIVQPFIAAPFEHRVVVVGDQVFSARTKRAGENAVDVRRLSPSKASVEKGHLPIDVAQRCVQLVKANGLYFAAIDLLETNDNDYVFLDLNPSGHFLWVEQLTGAPICAALADLVVYQQR